MRFVSGGCDCLGIIWRYIVCLNMFMHRFNEQKASWEQEKTLSGHTGWVRDVAWCPNEGMPGQLIATASQDHTVFIWTIDNSTNPPTKQPLSAQKFPDVVWRLSWSMAGNILAVSCGDMSVTLWKEGVDGRWECMATMDENTAAAI